MPIMPLSCVRNVKNVKVCENGSNIDYLLRQVRFWEMPRKPKFPV